MIRTLLFCLATCLLLNCDTNRNTLQQPPITDSNSDNITAQNYIQKEIGFVKPPSQQDIEYYFSVSQNQCFSEILVNNVPVFRFFEDGSAITPICINPYINQSGKQTLTYRLYPQKTVTDGEGTAHLTAQTAIKIELVGRKESDRINAYKNQKVVITHLSETKPDGKTFVAAGKNYYEYTITFDAEVPYKLVGATESQDLSKLDQKELLAKTEAAYRYYYNLISAKKMDDYFRLGFKSDVAEIISSYIDQEKLQAIEESDKFHFLILGFKLEPLEKYHMSLYGNGKIVCLEQTSKDPALKNTSPIWGKTETPNGEKITKFYKLYLHIPKGKDTFEILYKGERF
ncbi:hypothetical protein [Pedobacter sp. UBA5917]|jgi:hypothetical protein|uniref:hypothetical protein n=1 Tax=Pedobacter sp. UBA5917 TaxID=1947061 RepID=UPI0025FC16FF|nr:hypothetical protein [Pedobacter sp. UBA5917]